MENPPYYSLRDLKVLTKSINQGYLIKEKGQRTNVFSVQNIRITSNTMKYLWGIDLLKEIKDANVGIMAAEDSSVFKGPYN